MRRVEDVLGKGWENHVEGQRLKADGDSFRQKLNTQELFDDWSRKVNTKLLCFISDLYSVDKRFYGGSIVKFFKTLGLIL